MRTDLDADFGELIARRRRDLGITQEELAERAEISVRGISDLERGARRSPHLHTVQRLLEALEVPPSGQEAYQRAAHKYGRSAKRERDLPPSGLPIPPSLFIG